MIARIGIALVLALATACPSVASADPSLDITPAPVERAIPMMINLAPLHDWSTQQPFIDRMKTARPWIGHLPGRWGGLNHDDLVNRGLLDAQGWPTSLPRDINAIGTLLMVDLPEEAVSLSGRYVMRFEGTGIVEVSGRVTNVRYGKNQVAFDFTPGSGGIDLRIQRTDPRGAGDHVRDITIVREDEIELYQAGEIFSPDLLEMLAGFQGLRFMDWMDTNHSDMSEWADRALPGDYTFGWRGIPFELIAALANRTQMDPWLTLPHKATDEYFHNAANVMEAATDPNLKIYVEYSNEVWNWGFSQAAWAGEQAMARWGIEHQWQQFYGMRAAQMAQIWHEVFDGQDDRVTTVLSTQAAWLGLEEQALYAPLWQAEDEANPAPYTLFDAYAITGYMNPGLGDEDRSPLVHGWIAESEAKAKIDAEQQGLTGADAQAYLDEHRYDHAIRLAAAELMDGRVSGRSEGTIQDLVERVFPHHRAVADKHGLDLIMYEGGTHVVGVGPVVDDVEIERFFRAFNYSDTMGVLYSHLLTGWAQVAEGPFNVFKDVYPASKWGSFGTMRYFGDNNARWQTVRAFRDGPGG